MLSEVSMPKLGETMEEGRIIAWRKREGEAVRKGEVLLEVETDKANLEVEAAADGYLRKVLVKEDERVPVFTLLAYIGDLNDLLPAESGKRSPETPSAAGQVLVTSATVEIAPAQEEVGAVRASPRARKLAEEKGVDVRQLKGSGPRGRVQEKDVLAFLESQMEVEADEAPAGVETPEDRVLPKALAHEDSSAQVGAGVAILGAEHEEASRLLNEVAPVVAREEGKEVRAAAKPILSAIARSISSRARRLAEEHHIDWRGLSGSGAEGQITERDIRHRIAELKMAETVQPLSRLRQIIAERLTKSQQERAHIYLTGTVDMTEAVRIRDSLSGLQSPRGAGAEITYNDLFIKAVGICLTEYPWVNSSLVSEGVRMHSSANVGIAVAIEDHGLVVPVIQDVQRLTLAQIAGIRQELVKKAKERRLVPDEMAGGTFTLSNLGMYGVEQFTAIINPPETGILAVGAIMEEPRAIQGHVAIRPVMRVTLGVDHRVVDGALAAQFLQCFKTLLEQPWQLTSTEKWT